MTDKISNFLDKHTVTDKDKLEQLRGLIEEKGIYKALRQVDSSGDEYFDKLRQEYMKYWEALEFCLQVLGIEIYAEKCDVSLRRD